MTESVKFFRYVVLHDVGAYLAKGWCISNCMAEIHHGHYSVLMEWTGEGEAE